MVSTKSMNLIHSNRIPQLMYAKAKDVRSRVPGMGSRIQQKSESSTENIKGAKVGKREKQGKRTDVYVRGSLIPKSKLRKEIARYSYESVVDKYRTVIHPAV